MTTREHRTKYKALADKLGWEALLPKTIEQIQAALAEGDEHLNKWGNGSWERAALGEEPDRTCCCCGRRRTAERFSPDWPFNVLRRTARDKSLPWRAAPSLSLAARVCVLKYVARVDAEEDTGG